MSGIVLSTGYGMVIEPTSLFAMEPIIWCGSHILIERPHK